MQARYRKSVNAIMWTSHRRNLGVARPEYYKVCPCVRLVGISTVFCNLRSPVLFKLCVSSRVVTHAHAVYTVCCWTVASGAPKLLAGTIDTQFVRYRSSTCRMISRETSCLCLFPLLLQRNCHHPQFTVVATACCFG